MLRADSELRPEAAIGPGSRLSPDSKHNAPDGPPLRGIFERLR